MATPRSTRERRGLVTFAAAACCTGISFTHIAQALRPHNYLEKTDEAAACGFTIDIHLVISCNNSTHVTEYCAVIGPALHSARQQTAVKEVTRPLPSLAEWGVAMRDYYNIWGCQAQSQMQPYRNCICIICHPHHLGRQDKWTCVCTSTSNFLL